MHRRKVVVTAAALFAFGVAFAAQPTSLRADWDKGVPQQRSQWIPGTNTLMSLYEPSTSVLTPPR
jgi:hypothetical protein